MVAVPDVHRKLSEKFYETVKDTSGVMFSMK